MHNCLVRRGVRRLPPIANKGTGLQEIALGGSGRGCTHPPPAANKETDCPLRSVQHGLTRKKCAPSAAEFGVLLRRRTR